jgi:hypothetical protein
MADLTTLEKARRQIFGNDPAIEADDILTQLITSSSAWVEREVGGDLMTASITETRNGDGGTRLLLNRSHTWRPGRPTTTITSLHIDGAPIPARPAVSTNDTNPSGYVLDGDAIDLVGYTFACGTANVLVTYTAGYGVSGEAGTIPSNPGPYTVQAGAAFRADGGVTIATVAAVHVSGTPAAGQYSVDATGLYTFAAADAGRVVALSYATCPTDVEQATLEHIALRFRDRGRVGLASASGDGDSVSYSNAGTLAYIEGVLSFYRPLGFA